MNRTHLSLSIGALLAVIIVIVWLLFPHTVVSPSGTPESVLTVNSIATSSATQAVATTSPKRATYLVPLVKGDVVKSWNYDGYLNDNGPLEAASLEKIKGLKSQLGKDNDYQVYIVLVQEYDHLGDGRSAYEYLSRAIVLDTNETTGVGWHNMGVLMEKLGAYNTARMAHDKAVKIQPGISSFQISRIELMIYHFPKDTTGVEKAFKDAEATLGGADSPMILDLRQRWQQALSQ